MSHVVSTAPTIWPVTVQECKDMAGIEHTALDTVIERMLHTATEEAENYMERQIMTATHKLILDAWPPGDRIELPWAAPLQSVTSVAYTDSSGDAQTLTASTDYNVDTDGEPGKISLAYGKTWPSVYGEPDVITITYVCGWTAATSVPDPIVIWILRRVATLIEHREEFVTGTIVTPLPYHAGLGILDRYRFITII